MLRRIVGIVAFAFLSSFACGSSSAGVACTSTLTAVEFIQKNGISPLILRGKQMEPLVKLAIDAGSKGMESARFVAIVYLDDGRAGVFFGNAKDVCGPMMLDQGTVRKYAPRT